MKVLQLLIIAMVFLGVALGVLIASLRGQIGPEDAQFPGMIGETVVTAANSRRRAPEQLRGLVWNVHYGHGGELDHFAKHSPVEVDGTLEAIAELIKTADVDFVMLQEVDRQADRSHGHDQLRILAERAGFPYFAFVTTWNARYIPFPFGEPDRWLGRVHSGQGVLSRFPITSNRRVLLPQPKENPFWYNWFYLNRAVQVVELAVPDEEPVQLFNIHLEAFSNANRMRQATILKDLVWTEARQDDRILVAGDFNSTAPEAPQKKAFVDEPETDFSNDTTIQTLRSGMPTIDLLKRFKVPERIFTFPATAPNRQLDHLFAGRAWSRSFGWVQRPEKGILSDHLPLRIVLTGKPSQHAGSRKKIKAKRRSKVTAPPAPKPASARIKANSDPNTLPIFKGDTGTEGLGVEIRNSELLDRPTPVQGKPPKPPKQLNPKGWLNDAGPVIK